ncbi:hypothetical protein AT959_05220 [Dechloromonas denitrificans]|uniref:Pilus assembly protein PilO n=1 Tax=Dechloromonas denitrificans TaxID=281362 RepID=A0A133XLD7_9RHOO|nr:hypothetical protein [Dechloromonas denitrificans]KXB31754.1 hypothetical protein AT959_05220 [Dechloromonas denitrificans]
MEARALNGLLARARFALANPNWLLLAGSLLLLLAATGHLLLLPGRETAIEAGEGRLAALERSTRRLQIERQTAPEQGQPHLLERFPDASRLPGEVGRLLNLAESGGLQFSAAEYRLVAGKEKLLDRYVVSLPLQGGYSEIRQFLLGLRDEFPNLAIEDVSLRRDTIGASEVEVQLRLVIFIRRVDVL